MSTPSRLKLLYVSARYAPLVGGTETHVREVASRMAFRGHDVTVLTTDPTGDLPRREQSNGVEVRRIRAWPKGRDYYFAPGLYREIARGGWDVVHLQGYHTLVAPLTMAVALRAGIPYVVSFHSGGHSSAIRTHSRGLQRRLLRPPLSRARSLVAVSQFEAKTFAQELRLPEERFAVIFNGSTLPTLPSPLPEPDPGPLIISIGRLERYKGHHRAIDALATVRDAFPDARLRIVGDGPYEAELRSRVARLGLEERVEIKGIPAGDRLGMSRLLHQGSLVVLLSDYEAYPIAVLEALSVGRKVLVTNTSGLTEFAEYPPVRAIPLSSTPEEIGAAMVEQLRAPMETAAYHLPTWDECADALEAIYEDIAGSR